MLLQQELIVRTSGSSEAEIQQPKDLNMKVFDMMLASKDIKMLKLYLTAYLNPAFDGDAKQLIPAGMTAEKFIAIQVK